MYVSKPANACPGGQYEDGWFHICLPYGPSISDFVPAQLSCAQWALHPFYFQAIFVINHSRDALANAGIRDKDACMAAKGTVANIISQQYDFLIGQIVDDLFRCACMNAEFSPGFRPGRLACRVNPSEVPGNTMVTSCDGFWGPEGSPCACPRYDGMPGGYNGVVDNFPAQ
jgi:hypothetical protein